jgi:putative transposase
VFVLFFLQVGSRRVFVAGLTTRADRAWVVQQARNFLRHAGDQADRPEYLPRDYDDKFASEFDALLES